MAIQERVTHLVDQAAVASAQTTVNQEAVTPEIGVSSTLILGESVGFLIQTSLIAVQAVVVVIAALVAIRQLASSVEMSKKKAALDVIFTAKRDDKLQEGYREVRKLHADPDIRVAEYAYETRRQSEGFAHLIYVLNHYENVCVGINHGILDEQVIKGAEKSIIVRAYLMTAPFIHEVRSQSGTSTLFRELEMVVHSWDADLIVTPTSTMGSLRPASTVQ